MTAPINIGLIGCGKRFRSIYLPVLQELKINNKINIKNIFVRNLIKYKDIAEVLNCSLTPKLNDLLIDEDIKYLIITTPFDFRKKLFLNKLFRNKKVIFEVPFSNNLIEFVFFNKILKKKNISFEVFEDRFYMQTYNLKHNVNLIENKNHEWMHHFLGACFNINKNINNIMKLSYEKDKKNYKNFTIKTNSTILIYKFYSDKKIARSKEKFFRVTSKNHEIITLNTNHSLNSKQLALKKCVDEFFFNNFNDKGIYASKFLYIENLIITLMKIAEKFNLKKINYLEIKLISIMLNILSFFKIK